MVPQSAPKADYAPFIRYQRIDCRRRPGRADTGDGTCLPPFSPRTRPARDGSLVSARSMEIFRRLALADRIRNTGRLPPEYRNDVAMCVSVLGAELSREQQRLEMELIDAVAPLRAGPVQNGRVFIAGDAAHLWIPHAGYGMNAGIADAADLAWMLAAVLNGWAEPA